MNTNKNHSHALFKILELLFGVTLLWAAGGTLAHAQSTFVGPRLGCSSRPCGGS